ncbi:hypothetical protein HN51_028094, partial [Arachis hypogaea]
QTLSNEKAFGCFVSGSILIYGRNESIHSFKKIIGFVIEDDVLHENLTVEENLWFSAQCRLSADLSKPEKVLVLERVIEFLRLQSVRNSLVMEPSLLILDEPTSSVDS